MKKLFSLIAIVLTLVVLLAGCKSNGAEDDNISDNGNDDIVPCSHPNTSATKENIVEANCLDGGSYVEVVSCTNCNFELSRNTKTTEPLGHKASAIDFTEDFCNNDPVAKLRCSRCNIYMGEFGHRYVKEVKHPTCTEDGYELYKCNKCDDQYTEIIPSLGHIASEWTTVVNPTCYQVGTAEKICLICNLKIDTKSIKTLEHHYKTELISGEIKRTCYECSNTIYEKAPSTVYTVSFVENGGTNLEDISVIENSVPELPVTTKEGHVFMGWYYDDELTNMYTDAEIVNDITLYARFEKIEIIEDEQDIIVGVPLDYTFMITSNSVITDDNINDFVSVTNLGEENVPLHIVSTTELPSTPGAIYRISGDYQSGENYFVSLTDSSFLNKDSTTLWIKTEGQKENVITLKEGVYSCSSEEIYGLYENGDDTVLITYGDFLSKDQVVAFYDGDSDSYVLGARIKDSVPLNDYTTYSIEVLKIEDLFEECEISESDKVDFSNADINTNLKEEIAQAFKNSDLYTQYLDTVTAVAKKYGSSVGPVDFSVHFFAKGDVFTIKLAAEAEIEEGVEFMMDYYIDLGFDFDFALNGDKSTLILNSDMVNTVQLNVAFDDSELHGTQYVSRNALLREYKTLFTEIKERNMKIAPSNESGKGNPKSYYLAKIPLKCGAVTAYLTINGEFDFSMMGGLSAELVHSVKSTIGIRNGKPVNDYVATLESISGVSYAGIDVYGGIKVSLDVGFCGLYGYIDGSIGLRGELIASAALAVSDTKKSFVLGSYNFDSSVVMESNAGAKYCINLFGFEKTIFDTSMEVLKKEAPFISLGDNYVNLHFTDESNSTAESALNIGRVHCGLDINLKGKIDTSVLVLDVDNFKPSQSQDLPCEYIVNVISGFVKAKISNKGVMKINGSGDFLLAITVKYGGVIEKTAFIRGTANHKFTSKAPSDDTLRTTATCYSNATYFYVCASADCREASKNDYYEFGEKADHVISTAYYSDSNSHWKACTTHGCTFITEKASHEGGNASCTNRATCTICNKPYGATASHNYTGKVTTKDFLAFPDDCTTNHIFLYSCTVCKEIDPARNTFTYGTEKQHKYADDFTCHNRKCMNCPWIENKTTEHIDTGKPYCECGTMLRTEGLVFTETSKECTLISYTGNSSSVYFIGTFKGKPVTSIGASVFSGNTKLTHIDLPEGIKVIGKEAFNGCTRLQNVIVPNSVTTIGENAFQNCTNLRSVTIGTNVKTINDYAFAECTGLTEIMFNATAMDDYISSAKNNVFNNVGNSSSGITVTIGSNVTKIPDSLFCSESFNNVKEVVFMDNSVCKTIGIQAFYFCKNLISINIPESVTSIEKNAFSYTSLTSIEYGGTMRMWTAIKKGEDWDLGAGTDFEDLNTIKCTDGIVTINP